MFGFLSRLLGREAAPGELDVLAGRLIDYTQGLSAGAILLPQIDGVVADPKAAKAEDLVGKGYFDWTIEAQVFLVSFLVEVCIDRDVTDAGAVFGVVECVFREALKRPEAEAQGMTISALKLRQLAIDGEGGEELEDDIRKLIPVAALGIQRGKAFAARIDGGDHSPTLEELEDFVARFGGQGGSG